MIDIKPVPVGHEPAPGYILEVLNGRGWFTQDGFISNRWSERGVWPTPEAAEDALENFHPRHSPAT